MNKDYIFDFVDKTLTDKRKIHTEGVREMALKLCDIYGADKEKVEIAAICHDLYRGKSMEELNSLVKKYNLDDKNQDRYAYHYYQNYPYQLDWKISLPLPHVPCFSDV